MLRTNNNKQETGSDECNVEDNGLHRTWLGEDSANDGEDGSLVMMIATMRLDGLCRLTLQTWDNGRHNRNRGGGGRRNSGGRGGGQ